MPKVHNHYDNLKVAHDASPQDIRTAYRALTRKHHPDRNPGHADAQRVMAVVNVAYAVLSDPAKRREHDLWIQKVEGPSARQVRHLHTLHTPTTQRRASRADADAGHRGARAALKLQRARLVTHLLGHRLGYACAAAAALGLMIFSARALFEPGIGALIAAAPAAAQSPGYLRPVMAPNGRAWPVRSGYVDGYELRNHGGRSEITIDNSHNDADMFAKLVSLDGPTARPVRTVFVAARGQFRVAGVSIGTYDLRYRNLATGGLLRSPAFILEEVVTAGGLQHSTTTLTLYRSGSGNMQTYALSDAEFF